MSIAPANRASIAEGPALKLVHWIFTLEPRTFSNHPLALPTIGCACVMRRVPFNCPSLEAPFQPGSNRQSDNVTRDAMHGDFADLDHAPKVDQSLVLSSQLSVIPEIPQEPAQLPHRSGCAVQATGHETPGQMPGLQDGEADL